MRLWPLRVAQSATAERARNASCWMPGVVYTLVQGIGGFLFGASGFWLIFTMQKFVGLSQLDKIQEGLIESSLVSQP